MGEKYTLVEFRKQLVTLLQTIKGEKSDIAAAVYELIQNTDNREEAFQYFLENGDEIESAEVEEIKKTFTASELQKLQKECSRLVDGILRKLIAKNTDKKTFYSELWKMVMQDNNVFDSTNEKIYALYRIWIDGRIPYFELEDGLRMSNDEFQSISEKKKMEIKKAIFILNSSFEQRTERSSLLIRILESCCTEEEKSVVLAQILAISERKSMAKALARWKADREAAD